jgi:hypothetical protein
MSHTPAKLIQCRGDHRHTSSDDKYDLKKVVTSRFYSRDKSPIGTCHAHGDGTWNILLSPYGKVLLSKKNLSSEIEKELEVKVLQRIDERGRIFHYGEMLNKPDVCRRPVSENNDEQHRLKRAELERTAGKGLTELFSGRIQREEVAMPEGDKNLGAPGPGSAPITPSNRASPQRPQQSRYSRDDDLLTTDQEQLAADLAREDLTGKERRMLFQKMKVMPMDKQGMILERSKGLKS